MSHRSRSGFALAFPLAIVLLLLTAIPASAARTLVECSGACGKWSVVDTSTRPGVVCPYERLSREINVINVKPPKMWGAGILRKVEWRFLVRHRVRGGAWETIYTSPQQKASATASSPASLGHGFTRMKWIAPEDPAGSYLVWVEMRWLDPIAGISVGLARVEYDWYMRRWSGTSDIVKNRCVWRLPA